MRTIAQKYREEGKQEAIRTIAQKYKEEGVQIGQEKGIQIGEEKGKLEIARVLLSEGESIDRVVRLTGLSRSQLKGIL